jgi:hypothetical protein
MEPAAQKEDQEKLKNDEKQSRASLVPLLFFIAIAFRSES